MMLPITPRIAFEDNLQPAELLITVYRLLECEQIITEGELISSLRPIVQARPREDLMLIYNQIFIGLVRQNARVPLSDLKREALDNLLRQAVVAACTALDAYLPSLLKAHLYTAIKARGRTFIPLGAKLQKSFNTLSLNMDDAMRLITDTPEGASLYLANKILSSSGFKFLSNSPGVHLVGALLLGVDNPWQLIAEKLGRDAEQLKKMLDATTERRNDIVHRADRSESTFKGTADEEFVWPEQQAISRAFAEQSVDTIRHVCLALDELVVACMDDLRAQVGIMLVESR